MDGRGKATTALIGSLYFALMTQVVLFSQSLFLAAPLRVRLNLLTTRLVSESIILLGNSALGLHQD
jgi:hypothetical protein